MRLERGEDQYEVAAAAGVSRVIVTQWEGGKKKPGRRSLVALAKHFNVSMDFLLFGSETNGPVIAEGVDEERIILLLRRAPPHVRETVRTLLENTAETAEAEQNLKN